jgi:hypothetical protein
VLKLVSKRGGPFDRKMHRSLAQIAGALRTQFGICVSRFTVLQDLRALEFTSKVGSKEPILTPEKIKRRLKFIKDLSVPSELILFSDECYVGQTSDGRTEWCKGEVADRRQTDRFELKLMVFGIVGCGVSKYLVYPRKTFIDAVTYIECLKKCLLPILRKYPSRRFMQDNASAHTAKVTKDFFARRLEVCKLLKGKYIQHADGKKLMRELKKQ